MKTKIISFIKEWLLHFASLVFLFNFFDSIDYLDKISRVGQFYFNNDGSAETVWQRIMRHTFQNPEILEMAAFTMLVDVLYRFVFKKYRWPVFLVTSAICCCLVLGGHALLTDRELTGILQLLGVLIGYMVGYALLREFFHHKLYALDVRLGKSENELNVLKQQLDPHFLFNTLNYLYGTALQEKAARTAEGIEVMSGMMRYSVTGMQETYVPLAEEVGFVEQYIYLQRVRLSQNNGDEIKVNISTTANNLIIAPMLFIPFIENAFKHGVSIDNRIDININIILKSNELSVQVSNKIFEGNTVQGTNSGLNIAKKRLELLYPNKHRLEITRSNNRYNVSLVLTLQ